MRGLVAGLVHRDLGVSFAEAVDLLDELPPAELAEVRAACASQAGVTVVASSREWSVLDTAVSGPPGAALRSLHRNDAVDLVQSCVAVIVPPAGPDASVGPASAAVFEHARPPPFRGPTATAVQGLSLGVAVWCAANGARGPGVVRRVAVLGAGACSLPAHLHAVLPAAELHAVELVPEVAALAREHFGVAALDLDPRFVLHVGCAFEWAQARAREGAAGFDVVVVDLQFGPPHTGLIAPPMRVCGGGGVDTVGGGAGGGGPFAAVLAAGGVLVVNAVGSESAVLRAAADLGATAVCWVPPSDPAGDPGAGAGGAVRHAVVLCISQEEPVPAATVMQALARLPRLLDEPEAWLAGWRSPPAPRG